MITRTQRTMAAWLAGATLAATGVTLAGEAALAAFAAPAAPTSLAAAVTGQTVVLTWQPDDTPTLPVTYWLEAGSSSGARDLGAWPTTTPRLVAHDVPDGRYFVRVRAANADGPGLPSNEVVVRVGCAAALAAPANLMSAVTGNAVVLSWSPASGAAAYLIEAGSQSGLADVAVVPTSSTSVAAEVPTGTYFVRVRAVSVCGAGEASHEVVLRVGATQAPTLPIFGVVDPLVLGTCTAAAHDRWVVDGGDGFRYRTWHPQVDSSGCVFAHEHGDDPALGANAAIAASPVRFGYIGRRIDHDEAHEGFKVFIANPGDVNDEGRVNRVYSRSVFHMGTGGARRFSMPHHSAEIRLVHPEFGLAAFTQLMMDTGGTGVVCDPRSPAPVKDVVQLASPCRLSSAYEIWSTTQSVMFQGRAVYQAFATPAVFDPITVLNPANPAELVYAWDARVAASRRFTDDWSGFRGCDRESYAQPGYWRNAGGPTTFYTDALGQQVAPTDPRGLVQQVSAHDSIGAPATRDGLVQFKMRKSYCQQRAGLGLKN